MGTAVVCSRAFPMRDLLSSWRLSLDDVEQSHAIAMVGEIRRLAGGHTMGNNCGAAKGHRH